MATVHDNAVRIIGERRIKLAESSPTRKVFRVISDGSDPFAPTVYRVVVEGEEWDCDCPASRKCKHVEAAMLWLSVLGGGAR